MPRLVPVSEEEVNTSLPGSRMAPVLTPEMIDPRIQSMVTEPDVIPLAPKQTTRLVPVVEETLNKQIPASLKGIGMGARSALGGLASILDAPRLFTDPVNKAAEALFNLSGNAAPNLKRAYETPTVSELATGMYDQLTDGQFKPQTTAEKAVDFVGQVGSGIGGGSALAGLSGLIPKASREIAERIPKEGKELANLAMNKYNIPLSMQQVSGNRSLNTLQKVSEGLPFSGVESFGNKQLSAFNRAVSKTIGEDATEFTPEVMNRARDRLGTAFDNAYSGISPKLDEPFTERLAQISQDAVDLALPDSIQKFVDKIGSVVKDGKIDATTIGSLRSRLSKLSNAQGEVGQYYGEMKDALDDLLYRNLTPERAAALKETRKQYKNLKTIEKSAARDPDGNINPTQLMTSVMSSYKNAAYGGGDDINELAKIGKKYLGKLGGSDTFEKAALFGTGGGAMAAPLETTLALGGNRAYQSLLNRNQGLVNKSLSTVRKVDAPPSYEDMPYLLQLSMPNK